MKGCVDDPIQPDIMIREINCDHITVLQKLESCIPRTISLLVTVADKDRRDLRRDEISIDKLRGGYYRLKTLGGNHTCALAMLRGVGRSRREFRTVPNASI